MSYINECLTGKVRIKCTQSSKISLTNNFASYGVVSSIFHETAKTKYGLISVKKKKKKSRNSMTLSTKSFEELSFDRMVVSAQYRKLSM